MLVSIIRSQMCQFFVIFSLAIVAVFLTEENVLAQQAKDFNFSVSPSSVSAVAGSSANFSISLTGVGSFDKPVTFSAKGIGTANFSPNSVVPPATINLSVMIPSTTNPGNYSLSVTATGDGITKSQSVSIFVPQPPFSLAVSPTSAQASPGTTLSFTVTATLAGDTNTQTVMLSSSSDLAVSFANNTITAPGSTKMTVSIPSNASAGSYPVYVIGQASGFTQTAWVTIDVKLPPDFTINIIPNSVSIAAGGQRQLTVSVNGLNGFDQTVGLTVDSKLSAFLDDRAIAGGSGTTLLDITTDRNTPAGIYPVIITAISSNKGVVIQKMATATVTVTVAPDFALVLTPSTITSPANKVVSFDVSISPLNGFSDLVVLNTASQNSSINTTLSTTTISNTSSAKATVNIGANTAPGTYDINVSGVANGVQHSAICRLIVIVAGDFDLAVNPTSQIVNAGQSTSFILNTLAKGGFAEKISLTASSPSNNIQVSFSSNTIDATGLSTFIVSTSPTTEPKDYQIIISASGGGITKQVPVTLTVKAALVNDFTLAIKPDSQTVSAGKVTSFSLSVDGQNGFTGMVNLSAEIAEKSIGLAFSNNTPIAFSTVSITVSTSSTTPPGNYPIKIIGTAGSVVKTVFAAINVTPEVTDKFSLAIAPNLQAITSGESTMFTVGVVGNNGFSQTVNLSASSSDPTIQVSLDKTSIPAGATTFVTINTSSTTKSDVYTIMITGKSGSITVSLPVILVVREAALQVILSFNPPPVGQIAPPQNLTALATELKPTIAQSIAQVPFSKAIKPLDVDPNLAGFKLYRALAPADGQPPLTAKDIVKDENLIATLPPNQTGYVDIVTVNKNSSGNYVYSVTSFFGNGQTSGGSDPASTNLPVIKNPMFIKGTIFIDSPGSFIKLGATLIVNGMDEYPLMFTDSATQFTVAKKKTGSVSGKTLKKLIVKGATVQLSVKNPDAKLSIVRSLTRPKQ